MFDQIIYFGIPEFIVVALILIGVGAGLAWIWASRRPNAERRALLDGLPYPALVYADARVTVTNLHAEAWRDNAELAIIVADSLRTGQNGVLTVPAVDGQAYQIDERQVAFSDDRAAPPAAGLASLRIGDKVVVRSVKTGGLPTIVQLVVRD